MVEHTHPTRGTLRKDLWCSEPDTTNNRMALVSAADLLASLRGEARVVFTSDSRYLVDGMTDWVHGWARRGWRRSGGEIENLALWRRLVEEARRHEVRWRWVKGHAGHPQNEYANFLATRAAAEQTTSGGLIDSGFPGWLDSEREKGRYLTFDPDAVDAEEFVPGRRPPVS